MIDRRNFIRMLGSAGIISLTDFNHIFASSNTLFSALDFGKFTWGVATAAFQNEGSINIDDRGLSIWDVFSQDKRNIKDKSNAIHACDFYNLYKDDIALTKSLGFNAFRFSISWPRILPEGKGSINQKGIDFYNRVIDQCLEIGVDPWITLYHWDLPQALEEEGGWANRDIINRFGDYGTICAKHFGDRAKNWLVLNEPMAFTSLGYMTGLHAPGKKGLSNFLQAVHHATLSQAIGGRILRSGITNAKIGTTFSCSNIDIIRDTLVHENAGKRLDALLNRLFIEPSLGLGYPIADLPMLKRIEKYLFAGDEEQMKFDFDFIGLQHYFDITAKFSLYPPLLWAKNINAQKEKNIELTSMNWPVKPEGLYRVIKQFSNYKIKSIYITENGAAFNDEIVEGNIHDTQRIRYFESYLHELLRAKNDGYPVNGYFVWTLMDNFEWSEGYRPKFGLVSVDQNMRRIIKDSGFWFREFLSENDK